MRLIRFGQPGSEKPGVLSDENKKIDVSTFGEDYTEEFFTRDGIRRLKEWFEEQKEDCPQIREDERIAAPVHRPTKLICVGLNYASHAGESGMVPPEQPVLFMKATSSIVGPDDDLIIPRGSKKTDWEVELGVVIGRKASYVTKEKAMEYVAGYVLHNDYSERSFQLEQGGQWVKGKSADTFAPLGPCLVTRDEIPDPHNLRLWLKLNGQIKQDSNTSDLIFDIPYLVSYISHYMSLLPGDIISTGTPEGVGLGHNPPLYLKEGDVVELGIDGLGTSRQVARSATK